VAAFSLVGFALLAVTWRWLPRFWVWFTALFVALSLGPFVHIAGINTYIPGPWAFLRYVPVIGMARAPSRFSIVAALGMSVLAGFALDVWLRRSRGWSRRAMVACVLGALALELTPAPRQLYSADVPDVYQLVSAGAESSVLLELPTGIRDGTSSIGDFNASTQFFQTRHHRPLVGGYLSRVSRWRKDENRRSRYSTRSSR